jgi:hypothetical protein
MNIRHPRVETGVEPLYESIQFDPELVGTTHGSMDGGVECWGVSSGGKDSNPIHSADSINEADRNRSGPAAFSWRFINRRS